MTEPQAEFDGVDWSKCHRCDQALVSCGVLDFRTGGATGVKQFFFGQYAELTEEHLPMEILACSWCRTVEFRMPTAPQLHPQQREG